MASILRNRTLQRWVFTVYVALLTLGSLLPSGRIPRIPDWSDLFSPDKVAHFLAYAVFVLLLSVSWPARRVGSTVLRAVIVAALFGFLIEVLQGLAGTGRDYDPVDAVANTLGACLGGGLYALAATFTKRDPTTVGPPHE